MLGMIKSGPFGWGENARVAMTQYVHHNPVKRGLVAPPDDWRWSSWRFYYLEDRSILGDGQDAVRPDWRATGRRDGMNGDVVAKRRGIPAHFFL
jgi:hypothetical protein